MLVFLWALAPQACHKPRLDSTFDRPCLIPPASPLEPQPTSHGVSRSRQLTTSLSLHVSAPPGRARDHYLLHPTWVCLVNSFKPFPVWLSAFGSCYKHPLMVTPWLLPSWFKKKKKKCVGLVICMLAYNMFKSWRVPILTVLLCLFFLKKRAWWIKYKEQLAWKLYNLRVCFGFFLFCFFCLITALF